MEVQSSDLIQGLWVFANRCGVSKSVGLNYSFRGKILGIQKEGKSTAAPESFDEAKTSFVLRCVFNLLV